MIDQMKPNRQISDDSQAGKPAAVRGLVWDGAANTGFRSGITALLPSYIPSVLQRFSDREDA